MIQPKLLRNTLGYFNVMSHNYNYAKFREVILVNRAAAAISSVAAGAIAAVSAPAIASKTYKSVTITAVPAPANGQAVEYAIGTAADAPSIKKPRL